MSNSKFVHGRTLILGVAVLGLLATLSASPRTEAGPRGDYAPGEVLVKFKRQTGKGAREGALGKVKARGKKHLTTELDDDLGEEGLDVVSTDLDVEAAVAALRNDPNVEFAEPNWHVDHADVANDPYYSGGNLWGMYGDDVPSAGPAGTTNVYGCDAEESWGLGFTGSSSVFVGVIDEGAQFSHPDLAANVWTNTFDPVDGVDNDGNGYVDDVHGWDFFSNDNTTYDGTADDHGTHVSGTIGAKGGNAAGVAGVNWNVTLITAKFLGPSGGYTSGAVAALNYLRDLKVRHGIQIVCTSNSWGGGGYSAALHQAILKAAKEGILFVAAAGNANANNDTTESYPSNYSTLAPAGSEAAASYEAVIAVAAIDSAGNRASFSSYGATTVDIGAPGVGIYSTLPTNSYGSYSGTSMATPHVSGAVALYASAFPAATPAQIRSAILGNAKPTPSLAGKCVTGGRLSLAGLFGTSEPPTPPTETHDVAVTSISAPPSIKRNKVANVTIAVQNQGTTSETFQVTLTATGGTAGASKSVTLAAGSSTSVQISYRAPLTLGTVTLTGTASPVAGEGDTSDQSRSTVITVRQ